MRCQFISFKTYLYRKERSRHLQILTRYCIVYPLSCITIDAESIISVSRYLTLVLFFGITYYFTGVMMILHLMYWNYDQMYIFFC